MLGICINFSQRSSSMSVVERSFKNGEIIIREGDSGNSFFRLTEGSALVYAGFGKDDQIKLASLEAGEYFGEMAILEAYPRSATIVAKGNVSVTEIPGDELGTFLEEDPDRIIGLMSFLANRIQAMTVDYNESKQLLDELRRSDAAKKKSLFSKIKKHIDMYQSNKNKISEPDTDSLREELEKLKNADSIDVKNYRKGMIIFKEGGIYDSMCILHTGSVGMYINYRQRDEEKLADYNAVDFFGEMGIIADEPRAASAVSESDDTVVETIYRSDLESILRTCPEKIILILRHMSYRLRRLNIDFLATCKEITGIYNGK